MAQLQSKNGSTSLQAAIDAIDRLVAQLKAGELLTSSAAPKPASTPAAAAAQGAPKAAAAAPKQEAAAQQQLPKKEKKEKKEKPAKAAASAAAPASNSPASEEELLLAKAHIAVARVVQVGDHPSGSEKLLLCRVDWGGGERQGRLVAVVLNLKPAKLAGELSEAMILAADAPDGRVRVLSVPEGAAPGAAICVEGGTPPAAYPKQCKSDAWRKIVEQLAVAGGAARFAGRPLVVAGGTGAVTAGDMPDGAGIH
eukprot:scaffold2.g7484.t1